MIKKIIRKLVQSAYRYAAPPDKSLFHLNDTRDPYFGEMSGSPVDRYLINRILSYYKEQLNLNTGRAFEIGSLDYLVEFWPQLAHVELKFVPNQTLNFEEKTMQLVGDLQKFPENELEKFNLICLTQVLPYLQNIEEALSTLNYLLAPKGHIVGTVPFMAPISVYDDSRWGEWHRFTERSLRLHLSRHFSDCEIEINPIGNAITSASAILGIPSDDLDFNEMKDTRPSHCTLIGFRISRTN